MTIKLTAEGLRKMFPRAPRAVIEECLPQWQAELDRVGITHTRTRMSYFFGNIEHECGGFTIRNLTENINYTPERAAQIWPSRFPGGASQVRAKYGTDPGWQLKMFDDVYGKRMGNRPGTQDGSTFIGRGGPQWTGRDGYEQVERRVGLPATTKPEVVADYANQPKVCAAFWDWKKLNVKADTEDFKGCVKLWNGGQIGLADRLAQMAGNDPIISRLENVDRILPEAKQLPGSPPTATPPKEVLDEATKKERMARNAGAAGAGAGGAGEVAKKVGPDQGTAVVPAPSVIHPVMTYSLIGVGVVVVVVALILIARKKAAVVKNWF